MKEVAYNVLGPQKYIRDRVFQNLRTRLSTARGLVLPTIPTAPAKSESSASTAIVAGPRSWKIIVKRCRTGLYGGDKVRKRTNGAIRRDEGLV